MRFLSLIVGLVLGFLAAAWFYGAGGALTIAGRQIGPDIQPYNVVTGPHNGSSGKPADASAEGESPGSEPPAASAQEKPSTVVDNAYVTLRWPK
jgi:hypothetical protein